MSKIDFVFLAEFAKVEESATITAVGAGFRGLVVPEYANEIHVYVCVRILRTMDDPEASLNVTLVAPDDAYSIAQVSSLHPVASTHRWASTVIVSKISVPVVGFGEYRIDVSLSDTSVIESVPLMLAPMPKPE